MTTNVPMCLTMPGYWDEISVDTSASTAVLSIPSYKVWSVPDSSKNVIIEEEKLESEEELRLLFAEFAEEDIELAEMGMAEFNEILLSED